MTTDELLAGRELDVLIAEKVMGFVRGRLPATNDEQFTIVPADWTDFSPKRWLGHDVLELVPNYSTDIAAAWQVVEKLLTSTPQGGDIHIEKLGGSDWTVGCCFNKAEGGWDGWIEGATAPLAICRAALLALSPSSGSADGDQSPTRRARTT